MHATSKSYSFQICENCVKSFVRLNKNFFFCFDCEVYVRISPHSSFLTIYAITECSECSRKVARMGQETRRRRGENVRPRCNKEMRISFSLPYMLRRRTFPFADSTLDSRQRGVGVIRNRCLFYETFYLAAQPAFQYFVRLSSASFAIFAPELSFPIFSPLFLFASSRRPFFPYVSLRLHLLENDIYIFLSLCVCVCVCVGMCVVPNQDRRFFGVRDSTLNFFERITRINIDFQMYYTCFRCISIKEKIISFIELLQHFKNTVQWKNNLYFKHQEKSDLVFF